jgi:hypothetical protein
LALEQAKLYKINAREQLKKVSREELVNDKSTKPNFKGIIFKIANCSSGEKNIKLKRMAIKKSLLLLV